MVFPNNFWCDIKILDKDHSITAVRLLKKFSIAFEFIQGSFQKENQESQMHHFLDQVFILYEVIDENFDKVQP